LKLKLSKQGKDLKTRRGERERERKGQKLKNCPKLRGSFDLLEWRTMDAKILSLSLIPPNG